MGIIGLKHVLEEVSREHADKSDHQVTAELIRRLSELNYIPDKNRKNYERAFFREYKKFIGQPYERRDPDGLKIKVLGSGCPCCDDVDQDLMAVMTEMNLAGEIEHVTDPAEIGNYKVTGTPALLINGKVKAVGVMPKKQQLEALLRQAIAGQKNVKKSS